MDAVCRILKISRAAYYKWSTGELSPRTAENERIADLVEDIHEQHPEMGYRRLKDELDRYHDTHVNDKRMLRICRSRRIKSTIKYSNNGCTRQGKNPYYLADNLLNREFKADKPNQKWLTDVTEFKYYVGIEVKKVYLSAILDLLLLLPKPVTELLGYSDRELPNNVSRRRMEPGPSIAWPQKVSGRSRSPQRRSPCSRQSACAAVEKRT